MNQVFRLSRGVQSTAFQEFAPITLIGQVLGIFPLKKATVSGNQVLVTSRGAMIYSVVLLGLTFTDLMYLPQMTVAASNFENGNSGNTSAGNLQSSLSTKQLLTRLLNGIVMSLMAIFSKINAIWFVRRYLPEALTTLKSIDGLLEVTSMQRRNNINAMWTLVGLSILVGIPGQIYSWIFIHMGQSYFIGIYVFVNNFNNFTAISAEVQFLAMCYLLKSRFEIINRRILDILDFYNLEPSFRTNLNDEIISTQATEIFSISDIKHSTTSKKKITVQKKTRSRINDNLSPKTTTSQTIQTLRIGHQRLCDALNQVNHMFQLQLLFSISGSFLNKLLNVYSFFSGGAWTVRKNTGSSSTANKANTTLLSHPLLNLMWAIYYGIRIIAMAAMASKTTHAAKRSLIHILDIRRSSLDFATKEELTLFHDHITSRKIEFSAAGFFNVDIPLLSSVVATGSTYLVVMVQFHE